MSIDPDALVHVPSTNFTLPFEARIKVTSVAGHVFSLDFAKGFESWDRDPALLFDAPTQKVEATPGLHLRRHLQEEATGCTSVVLWLDCDPEGENICFEVLDCIRSRLSRPARVLRAKFSSVSPSDIVRAMGSLGEPNRDVALAVDARQELDLKVGVAFTRFQTRFFQGRYSGLDSALVSYGPCQTPTLYFVAERHAQIVGFKPQPFWKLVPRVVAASGETVELAWARGRVFDKVAAGAFERLLAGHREARCTEASEKEAKLPRPLPLNTVEMLKVGSKILGLDPHTTMHVAERLYTQGYITYPRTETSAYPDSFDIKGAISDFRGHADYGEYAASLLRVGFAPSRAGVDLGDHPPITPQRSATEAGLGGGVEWRLYDYIARHFLASVSPDCRYLKLRSAFALGEEAFELSGKRYLSPGFALIFPWVSIEDEAIAVFQTGDRVRVESLELREGVTSPPSYLSEADLIGKMEKNGIGTDASIATHIKNICDRNYARVEAGRRMVPTSLGIVLINGYLSIDPELALPQLRREVEKNLKLIAEGKASQADVVAHALGIFSAKFHHFRDRIAPMESLFEASFSSVGGQAKPLSRCGKCRRYMTFIPLRPQRLHCKHCDETYALPQGGTIKLFKELVCPLDGFEIVLFSLGANGKSYPVCPYCYSHPPFDGFEVLPCTRCPHPTCDHSLVRNRVCPCPDCADAAAAMAHGGASGSGSASAVEGGSASAPAAATEGVLVLDEASGPNWKLACNACSFILYLPEKTHRASVAAGAACEECGAQLVEIIFHKDHSPLAQGVLSLTACVSCHELLNALCRPAQGRTKHSKFSNRRGRGGGRGGRGGRGRGRGGRDKNIDIRMTFDGF